MRLFKKSVVKKVDTSTYTGQTIPMKGRTPKNGVFIINGAIVSVQWSSFHKVGYIVGTAPMSILRS